MGFYGFPHLTTYCLGGTITESNNYKIHTFTSSGIFTFYTRNDLLVDILVIAGGGGGGGDY